VPTPSTLESGGWRTQASLEVLHLTTLSTISELIFSSENVPSREAWCKYENPPDNDYHKMGTIPYFSLGPSTCFWGHHFTEHSVALVHASPRQAE